jgi:hypothetical protein
VALLQFAVESGHVALVKDEVVELCHQHAEFLSNHFPHGTSDEGFDWKTQGREFYKFINALAVSCSTPLRRRLWRLQTHNVR